jgi:hypothetical protein
MLKKKIKSKSLSSCSGSGYALRKSTSKAVRKIASKNLNSCKK